MSDQGITNFRIFAEFVRAEVRKRGGRVEAPRSALVELARREWGYRHEGETIVFTLKVPDDKLRNLCSFSDRHTYRLDVMMKYLIMTIPGEQLIFTNTDLEVDESQLLLGQHLGGLFASVTDNRVQSLSGDGQTIILGDTITIIKDEEPPLLGRRN